MVSRSWRTGNDTVAAAPVADIAGTSWNVSNPGSGTRLTDIRANSASPAVFGGGNHGLRAHDNSTSGRTNIVGNFAASVVAPLQLDFDIYVHDNAACDANGDQYFVRLRSGANITGPELSFIANANGVPNPGTFQFRAAGQNLGQGVTGAWYHVLAQISAPAGGTFDVTITDTSGATVASGMSLSFQNAITDFDDLFMGNPGNGYTGQRRIDNVVVQTMSTAVIPEPLTAALMPLALTPLLLRRRRAS